MVFKKGEKAKNWKGFRVLVFWEREIKVMELEDLRNKIGGNYFGRGA